MDIFKRLGAVSGLVLIALGVLCYMFRNAITEFFAVTVGLIILVMGIYKVIEALVVWRKSSLPVWSLITGAIFLAVGIYLLLHPLATIRITGVFIGVFAFLAGFDRFRTAVKRKKEGFKCGNTLITGLIHMAFGVVMCLIPVYGINTLIMVTGVYLLVSGILMLLSVFLFKDL